MAQTEPLRRRVTITPRFLLFVLLPLLTIFAGMAILSNLQIGRLKTELQNVEKRVLEAHAEVDVLEERLAFVSTDQYIEQEARRRFGYLGAGETRYVLEEPSQTP